MREGSSYEWDVLVKLYVNLFQMEKLLQQAWK